MTKRINFKYFFLAPGERVTMEWRITADYTREEIRAFDIEGDLANMHDILEPLIITSVEDWTLGYNSGTIQLKNVDADLRRDIYNTGLRAASQHYAQIERERNPA